MNLKNVLLSISALMMFGSAGAQDRIYKKDGSLIEAIVKEVGVRTISYNRYDNENGPMYTIAKGDLDRIEYENGTNEYFTPQSRTRQTSTKSNVNYGKNVIAFAPMQVNNGGVGIGLSYERILDKNGIIAFYLPVTASVSNQGYYSPYGTVSDKSIFTYFVMPGIKIYPTGGKGVVRYGVGPSLAFLFGKDYYTTLLYNNVGNVIGQYEELQNHFGFGIMINNSLNINPTKHLYLGVELGLGFMYYENIGGNTYTGFDPLDEPLAQFGFKVGYRF